MSSFSCYIELNERYGNISLCLLMNQLFVNGLLTSALFRISRQIKDRLRQLEGSLASRSTYEQEILDSTKWLTNTQDEVKRLIKPVGLKVDDAENALHQSEVLTAKLDNYEPAMKQLGQFGDEIQAAGQNTGLQEIERLQTLYEELRTQVAAQSTKLSYAVEVREQYHNTRGDLETCVRDCQDHLEAVSLPGVSIPAKLDKYKVTFDD